MQCTHQVAQTVNIAIEQAQQELEGTQRVQTSVEADSIPVHLMVKIFSSCIQSSVSHVLMH